MSVQCPCGLNQRQLERLNKFNIDSLRCTAQFSDDSGRICGKLLGAHPRSPSSEGSH